MGFASYLEDITFRASENGVDLGAIIAAIPTYDPFHEVVADERQNSKPKTIRLLGEEAKEYILRNQIKATKFAFLLIVDAKSGRLLQEYPFNQRSEIEARLAEFEKKHPGLLRLEIAKRWHMPQNGENNILCLLIDGQNLSVTIRNDIQS